MRYKAGPKTGFVVDNLDEVLERTNPQGSSGEIFLFFFEVHSALKLEKSAISKVQKHIFCIFKNGKISIFAPAKSLKLPKMPFSE